MTPTFRLALTVPLLATAALLSACASDKASSLGSELLAHVSLEGFGFPRALAAVRSQDTSTHLQASDAAAGDVFGAAVALSRDGNTLAVGADLKTASGVREAVPAAGSVYVYTRTPQGWREQARLLAPVPTKGSGFGHRQAFLHLGGHESVGEGGDGAFGVAAVGRHLDGFELDANRIKAYIDERLRTED